MCGALLAQEQHRSQKTQGQQLEALRVEYGIKRIVTWHLELLSLQAHAAIDVCNVRIAMLIACSDEPLTITWGNLHVGEIGNEEETFQNSLQEWHLEFEQGMRSCRSAKKSFKRSRASAGRPLSFWGSFFVWLELLTAAFALYFAV
jgi:hypothetical protein